jgi:hypothetical protein
VTMVLRAELLAGLIADGTPAMTPKWKPRPCTRYVLGYGEQSRKSVRSFLAIHAHCVSASTMTNGEWIYGEACQCHSNVYYAVLR